MTKIHYEEVDNGVESIPSITSRSITFPSCPASVFTGLKSLADQICNYDPMHDDQGVDSFLE